MKNKKMLEAIGALDDKYIEEADPGKASFGKRIRISVLVAAACIALLTASLWLFVPYRTTPPDVSRYENDVYYELISTLNEVSFSKPTYENRFEELVVDLFRARAQNAPGEASPDGASTEDRYVETTDNQVAGVIEADLIKRSDRYIYYLGGNTLSAYPIEGEATRAIGTYSLPGTSAKDGYYAFPHTSEFYLSSDCKTITVVRYAEADGEKLTEIFSLDVTDPMNITEKKKVTVSGEYLTSRLNNGKLLVISNYHAEKDANFSKREEYIPAITNADGAEYVSPENIFLPDNISNAYDLNFVIVSRLDEATLESEQMYSFFTYYTDAYVSNDTVYLFRNYTDKKHDGDLVTRTRMSEIVCLSYSDELIYTGSVNIPGRILDQYSLDEKDDILRVVTTTHRTVSRETVEEDGRISAMISVGGYTSASLYCVNLNTKEIVASVENFAPEGETVFSVRFDGDNAYVCTAIFVSDPVFFFDLSDLNNITYKETETIEGFSTSLVNFGDGFLLGIGTSDGSSLKIEVYREGTDSVIPVCKYEIENADYSEKYKAYFIDRENGLVGLGVSFYNMDSKYASVYKDNYLLLHFDGERFTEVINTTLPGSNDHKRAALIDGCFYMFSPETFEVQKIADQ